MYYTEEYSRSAKSCRIQIFDANIFLREQMLPPLKQTPRAIELPGENDIKHFTKLTLRI